MGKKDTVFVSRNSQDEKTIVHGDGSYTEVKYKDGFRHTTHYGGSQVVSQKTDYDTRFEIEGPSDVVWSMAGLFLVVFFFIGLFSMRDSTYTMLAAPVMTWSLLHGAGLGIPLIATLIGVSVLGSVLAFFCEDSGGAVPMLWSLLAGIGIVLVQVFWLKPPAYVYYFATENLIEYAALLVSTVIHVFFFMMVLQMATILLSFNLSAILFHWGFTLVLFVLLNLLSFVFMLCGSNYPTDTSRYATMIGPSLKAFGLTSKDIHPFIEWASSNSDEIAEICALIVAGVLALGVVAFVIGMIVSLIKDSVQEKRRNR